MTLGWHRHVNAPKKEVTVFGKLHQSGRMKKPLSVCTGWNIKRCHICVDVSLERKTFFWCLLHYFIHFSLVQLGMFDNLLRYWSLDYNIKYTFCVGGPRDWQLHDWTNDPCSFTSCCQVLDTEEVAVRHESHQGNQRDRAGLICLIYSRVLLTAPDFFFFLKKREKVNEYFCF